MAALDSLALVRLREERKSLRKDKPFGFWARPVIDSNGTQDMMHWVAGIPGKVGSIWEGGEYRLNLYF